MITESQLKELQAELLHLRALARERDVLLAELVNLSTNLLTRRWVRRIRNTAHRSITGKSTSHGVFARHSRMHLNRCAYFVCQVPWKDEDEQTLVLDTYEGADMD